MPMPFNCYADTSFSLQRCADADILASTEMLSASAAVQRQAPADNGYPVLPAQCHQYTLFDRRLKNFHCKGKEWCNKL